MGGQELSDQLHRLGIQDKDCPNGTLDLAAREEELA
jgi:hypothetical protein